MAAVDTHDSESTPIKWMSKMGFAAMAFGAVSMTFVPFPVSTACIYAGMFLICLDLWVHRFPRHGWFKPLGGVAILAVAALFTWKIVLHQDPLFCSYRQDGNGIVHLYVDNGNNDDLHDLDFAIHLTGGHYIAQVVQISRLGSCSLFPVAPGRADGGDSLLSTSVPVPSPLVLPVPVPSNRFDMQTIGSFQRIRCTELPNNSVLELGIVVVMQKDPSSPVNPGPIVMRGKYIGLGKPFKINEEVATFREQARDQR